jgi:hypothetical protein
MFKRGDLTNPIDSIPLWGWAIFKLPSQLSYARCAMSNDPFPRDAIFIKIGKFQVGAFGRLAVVLAVALTVIFLGHLFGAW